MSNDLLLLTLTAAGIGFLHTLLGPDHYLPFAFLGRAGRWSRAKLLGVTLLCGVAHVLSSVVLGFLGIVVGAAATRLEVIESARAELATYALIGFGLVYFLWGLKRALQPETHAHRHAHADGTVHSHPHLHGEEHLHVHLGRRPQVRQPLAGASPWALALVFVLGPCEPLIPLLMVPAAQKSTAGVLLVILVFAATTLATMLTAVLVCQLGLNRLPLVRIEPYSHAVAGAAVALCGLAIQFLGV
jgi:ABC-type nickel/cobalt efflux system permease component RcnA